MAVVMPGMIAVVAIVVFGVELIWRSVRGEPQHNSDSAMTCPSPGSLEEKQGV